MGVAFGEKPVIFAAIPGATTANGWRFGDGQAASTPLAQPTPGATPAKTLILSGHWTSVPDLPRAVSGVAVNPANSKQVLAGQGDSSGGGDLYKSEDGGLTWKKAPGWNGKGVWAVAFSGGSSPSAYAINGRDGEIFASQDGGITWKKAGKSPVSGSFGASLAVAPSQAQIVYYVGDPRLAHSDNGGQSWLPAGDGLPVDNQNAQVLSIAIDPTNPKIVYAGTGGFVGSGRGVYKSVDGGLTWAAGQSRYAGLSHHGIGGGSPPAPGAVRGQWFGRPV